MVQTDNTTCLSYLNQRGEAKSCSLDQLTLEFTLWCLDRGITLLAVHLAGANNIDPDLLSRQLTNRQLRLENSVEWSLDQGVANLLCCVWGNPIIDLFTPGSMRKYLFFSAEPLIPRPARAMSCRPTGQRGNSTCTHHGRCYIWHCTRSEHKKPK